MQAGANKPFLSIFAASPSQAIIFGAYRMCVRTADAGMHWTDCSLNVADPISHNLYDVVQDKNKLYLVGEAGDVFVSNDAGQTFTSLASPAQATLFGILVTAKDSLLTFGVAGGLYRSTDGGKSWIQSEISVQSDLTAGTVLSSGDIIVTSEAGGIYLSKDDGQSFALMPENEGMALFDVVQAANGNLVFVGSGGVSVVGGLDH
jgi:photosystem II stability/assembly factor-like uncharacterized protein